MTNLIYLKFISANGNPICQCKGVKKDLRFIRTYVTYQSKVQNDGINSIKSQHDSCRTSNVTLMELDEN